jgi:release factor glutamine methyltransferase
MRCSPRSGPVNWPRVTGANPYLVSELIESGLSRREVRWLVEEFMTRDDAGAIVALRLAAQRRLAGEPLQYIIGHWPFRSLDLDIDPRVLIPRPETEELVDVAIFELTRGDVATPLILDLGCGSGAIGLSLLAELGARGVLATLIALDESPDALAVARRNAAKHRLHAVSFVQSSWFDELDPSLRGHFDLIVANPPYVGEEEFESLDPVLRHEPRGALVAADFDGGVGLEDLATIIVASPEWLSGQGVLICEHGLGQRDAVVRLAVAAGFAEVTDHDDLAGHPRILVARRR